MKIKKLLIGLFVFGLAFSFTGCGDKVINDKGEKVSSYGQFIEIKRNSYTDNGGNSVYQTFMYDKDTKIVYVYTERSYSTSTMPYYVLDENGKPENAIYGENYNGWLIMMKRIKQGENIGVAMQVQGAIVKIYPHPKFKDMYRFFS